MANGKTRLTAAGLEQMKRRLLNRAILDPQLAERALYRFGEHVMARSKNEFVPVDDGPLRASGRVTIDTRGKEIAVVLSYGDNATPYARAIHEHLSGSSPRSWRIAASRGGSRTDEPMRRSSKTGRILSGGGTVTAGVMFHPAGRGPKYLERPLREEEGRMVPFIAQEMGL